MQVGKLHTEEYHVDEFGDRMFLIVKQYTKLN